jgi:hypothetical protein
MEIMGVLLAVAWGTSSLGGPVDNLAAASKLDQVTR